MLNKKRDNSSGDMKSIASEDEIKESEERHRAICLEEKDGFAFVVEKFEDEDGNTCAQGMTKVSDASKDFVLQTVFTALELEEEDVARYLLTRKLATKD
jgi:hypothetical protein